MADRARRLEYLVGLVAVVVTILLAILEVWPFDEPRSATDGSSLWEVLVHHGPLLGLLRLAIVVAALYAIASVPALVATGRWMKGVGAGGVVADDGGSMPRRSRWSRAGG